MEDDCIVIEGSLSAHKAGQSARAQAKALRLPLSRRILCRLRGARIESDAWSRGADGEVRVGSELEKLPREQWFVFHDVILGTSNSNVDHLIIGPPGVFCVNAKNLSGSVWVAERALLHNGFKTDYLPKSTAEARRVKRCLDAAMQTDIHVQPMLVILCDHFTMKAPPSDVLVCALRTLRSSLLALPPHLDRRDAFAIASRADRPSTWRFDDTPRSARQQRNEPRAPSDSDA